MHYLEKENRLNDKLEAEFWFNHLEKHIEPYEVRNAIDGNIAKLCKADSKFFLVNISPSQKELKFLEDSYGKKEIKKQLQLYAKKVMDEYAKNFKRDGIASSKYLMWFAKIENHRYYGHKDKVVISGEKKRGERKDGNQMHIQVIVSRKDVTNKIKLSPMNNSRGKNAEHSKKLGQFDRTAFKQSGEIVFDKLFGFDRGLKETFAHANIKKNGILLQKEQLKVLELGISPSKRSKQVTVKLARGVAKNRYPSTADMLNDVGKTVGGFMELMLEPSRTTKEDMYPNLKPSKKKKKTINRDQGYRLGR